jgi:hypothetical protein
VLPPPVPLDAPEPPFPLEPPPIVQSFIPQTSLGSDAGRAEGCLHQVDLQQDAVPESAREETLSCPLNRSLFGFCFRHRLPSSRILQTMLILSAIRSTILGESSGAPCTLPRSATGGCGCPRAASEPSGRIFPSDSRGHITSTRAWSGTAFRPSATGKISCVPSILVCTSPHPPGRSSCVQNPAVTMTGSRMS